MKHLVMYRSLFLTFWFSKEIKIKKLFYMLSSMGHLLWIIKMVALENIEDSYIKTKIFFPSLTSLRKSLFNLTQSMFYYFLCAITCVKGYHPYQQHLSFLIKLNKWKRTVIFGQIIDSICIYFLFSKKVWMQCFQMFSSVPCQL